MANRYSTRSDRDRNRDRNRQQKSGGSRREQNFNEYNRGENFPGSQGYGQDQQFSSGYNQGFGAGYSPGQGSTGQSFGGNRGQSGNWGQNRGNEFQNIGSHYGGGSQRDFGRNQFGDDRQGRWDVGRDFLTNQPTRESYGQMDDAQRSQVFGPRSSGDYGNEFRYSEPSRSFNRDYTEHGGYLGSSYGSYGDREFESGRTPFDESIAGRSYYGTSSRDYGREGWRGYGSRPGNMGFGDRERPDEWNRNAYGSGTLYGSENRQFGSRSGRDLFNTDYGSTQYGGYDRNRDDAWSFSDRDRYRGEESFGDKVKNFFGVGPKGYRRSDERIREDISERLEDHPAIDASNIEIQVRDGEVTLTGTTDTRRAKRLAEDVTEDVRGVKDVHNQVRVQFQTETSTFGDLTSGSRAGTTSETGSTSQASSGTTGSTTSTTKKGSERAA